MTSSMSAWYPLVRNRSDFSTRFGVSRRPSRSGSSPICRSTWATRSCIRPLYRMGCWAFVWVLLSAGAARGQDADALYANRAVLADAKKAAAVWQTRIDRDAKDFEAAWKRARAGYWIGGHEKDQSERDRAYEQAMA